MPGRSRQLALGAAAATVALAASLLLPARWLAREMELPAASAAPVRIDVAPGEPLRVLLSRLQEQGAVRHASRILWYLRLQHQRPRVQAGTYLIGAHATPRAILEQLAAGRVLLEQLTVVEGWNFGQLRRALEAHAALTQTLEGLSEEQLMRALGHDGEPAEGRFFPDTYRFAAGTSDRRILELAYGRMQQALAQAWSTRAPDLPLSGPGQALILASIVEKETAREDERARVAAVFLNRLRRGMRLQSDPTVIFGLGARYDGTLHARDLAADSPYNSYTRAGLPPTPIALPGAAALEAAVHPAATDALYFVATGNGDGSHQFSATLAEHDLALRAWLHKLGSAGSGSAARPRANP
jgi:UPF0755 protein